MIDFKLPFEVTQRYLERRRDEIVIFQKSLSENNVKEFNRIGHQLAGNATSYGFNELTPIASRMESLKADELQSEGTQLFHQFKEWLKTVQQEKKPF